MFIHINYMQKVLNEQELQQLYNWVDQVPLSRPKRNMARDFSDAVLMAELVSHFNPKAVELHNYIPTGSLNQKINNWKILNDKVLKKLKIVLTKENIESLANGQPNQAQKLIFLIKKHISEEGPTPTVSSKVSKVGRMTMGIGQKKREKKQYTFKQAKRVKEVAELLQNKDKCIDVLKEQVQILGIKFSKLEEMIKSKDRQIEQLVKKIKSKGLT